MNAARRSASSANLALGGREQRLERRRRDPAVRVAPAAGDPAVDEERRQRLRRLRVEEDRSKSLGQDARAAGVDEQHRVPRAQEAHRGRRVRVRDGCAGQVDQRAARLVAEAARGDALGDGLDGGGRKAGPAGDVAHGRRPEAGQVAANEVLDARVPAGVGRPQPVIGGDVQVGAALLPRARRRRPQQVDPEADPVPQL
jgi:hypothetical protein